MVRMLLLFVLASLVISCRKESCTGDCADVQFIGQVTDGSSKQGMAKVPVRVYWAHRSFCLFCSRKSIASTGTNSQGSFRFTATVDRAKFEHYYLRVEAAIPAGYIHAYSRDERVVTELVSRYTPQVNNINMVMYPKADLTIKLVKNQNDTFNYFTLKYAYSPTRKGIFHRSGALRDTAIQVTTAANMYTRIEWSKRYGPGQTKDFADSIRCSPNTNNVFILNY